MEPESSVLIRTLGGRHTDIPKPISSHYYIVALAHAVHDYTAHIYMAHAHTAHDDAYLWHMSIGRLAIRHMPI